MTRVLFVDDESRVLEGLQRMLRARRHEWEMVFAGDAPSALEACECYFQAFQFVIWSGTPARDALASVLFETQGSA